MRSMFSVIVGLIFVVVVTIAVDMVLHVTGVYPSGQPLDHALALLATVYRVLIGIGGAWLTAKLAPARPMKHALILGGIGTFLALLGLVATWGKDMGPEWYPVSLAVLALPQSWLGARLYLQAAAPPEGNNNV